MPDHARTSDLAERAEVRQTRGSVAGLEDDLFTFERLRRSIIFALLQKATPLTTRRPHPNLVATFFPFVLTRAE